MAHTDVLEILLTHDQWGTRQILETCKGLTEEQFQRRFEMGPGSLHDTMTHVLAAMRTWTQTLAGEALSPRIDQEGKKRTPGELLALLDAIGGAFRAEARRRPLDETVERERGGKVYRFSRAEILTHVATHGMHHRAQCLNMMRQLGVTPLPPSGVTEWARLTDSGNMQ